MANFLTGPGSTRAEGDRRGAEDRARREILGTRGSFSPCGEFGPGGDPLFRQASQEIGGLPDFIRQQSGQLRQQLIKAGASGASGAIIAAAQAARRARGGNRGGTAALAARAAAGASGARTAAIAGARGQALQFEIGSLIPAAANLGQFQQTSSVRNRALQAFLQLQVGSPISAGQVAAAGIGAPTGFGQLTAGIGNLAGAAKSFSTLGKG